MIICFLEVPFLGGVVIVALAGGVGGGGITGLRVCPINKLLLA